MYEKNKFSLSDDNRSHSGEELPNADEQKVKALHELKKLEKTLNSLIGLGKEDVASKYLRGFLEIRKVKSLDAYLNKLV